MRALSRFAPALLLLGCGNTAAPADASAPGPPPSASAAVAPAAASVAPPSSLARSVTPHDRRERDEKACEANDASACRRAADRYRGYGHVAGCGVDRDRKKPYRAVIGADAQADARLFDKWLRRACDLGDTDACIQGKNNVASRSISEHDVDVCARGALDGCALYLWQAGMHPELGKSIASRRVGYMKSGVTAGIFGDLYRREKARGGDSLPKDVLDLAERICASTLECDDVMMMLDKNGYGPAALAPLKKSAGEALVAACLAGDCVCGEAIPYLDAGDPRRADLARIGCDGGEPDACYWLGRQTEPSDMNKAIALYDVACPPITTSEDLEEIYSRAACDRLSELNEEGRALDKDSDRAFFYATLACTRGGFERDHAPCLRRAMFHARGYKGDLRWSTETSGQIADDFFYGILDAKECERPSVQALCKEQEGAMRKAKLQ
jgi:TPR repeat protein